MSSKFLKSALLATLALAPIQAAAHTTSIGYESAGPGAVNFWYGTYHFTNFTEGSFSLVGQDVTYSSTVPFSLITGVKPTGLVDGDTNFYSGFGATTLVSTPQGQAPAAWQGVSFTNLVAGTYVFTYIPIANPTQDWAPINNAILSSSVTLTAALLGPPPGPSTIDLSKPTFTQEDAAAAEANGGLIFDGGTLAPTSGITFNQPVTLNLAGGKIDSTNGNLTIANTISGDGALTKLGPGTLILLGDNNYTGGTTIDAGTLQGDALSLKGAILNNANLTFAQLTNATFAGTLDGSGALTKTGAGTLNINTINNFKGKVDVLGGKLSLNGTMDKAIATIGSGGEIGGNGKIGGLIVKNLATAAPGNSIGQLQVATFVIFEPGSTYAVEVNAAGESDKIAVTDTATLQGGTVKVLAEAGSYQPVTNYRIITATGGVTGTFANATSNFAFLSPLLAYDSTGVTLTLIRNDLTFAGLSGTINQTRAGAAADQAFRYGTGVYSALIGASTTEARTAFDRLSGEAHASAAGVAFSDANLVRGTLASRLAQPADGKAVWGQALGAWGDTDGNGNAAAVERETRGVLFGAETGMAGTTRLGLAGGYTKSDVDVTARTSSSEVEGLHAWAYGGTAFDRLRLRGGVGYSALTFKTDRTAAFRTFSDRLSSDHDGTTFQAFADVGYAMELGSVAVEPFASIAAVSVKTDAFTERGGAAALAVAGADHDVTFSTVGVRTQAKLGGASLHAMAGWQSASGDLTPMTRQQFKAGGSSFLIVAAPLDDSALILDAGVDLKVAERLTARASYAGQIGDQTQDHAVKASLTYSF